MDVLRLDAVSKRYGALTVTDDVSLAVPDGQALGIIGPNGAGKSTLFNLVGGSAPVSDGRIFFNEVEITDLSAAERCNAGIARSFQVPHPFVGLTVYENLLVAEAFGAGDQAMDGDTCRDILQETGLISKANTPAGKLSLLERKRLELARALATRPRLLLLDEIAGGLTEGECRLLVDLVRRIHASGVSIIWIEHIVHALTAVAERLVVIDYGRVIADGAPGDVINQPVVKEIYLGIDVDDEAA